MKLKLLCVLLLINFCLNCESRFKKALNLLFLPCIEFKRLMSSICKRRVVNEKNNVNLSEIVVC
jgi:hypothetical protein